MSQQTENSKAPNNHSRVFVWDVSVRLFHWTLVVLMVALFVTAEVLDGSMDLHATFGRLVLVLVLFRIIWGFIGSSYARFSQFLRGPRVVLDYSRSLLSHQSKVDIGHNPLGGWMVLVLLAALLLQAILGLFANDDILFDGPLAYLISKESSDLITGLHSDLFNILLVLVALHVSAVIWHKLFKGENLLSAMFSGYKELPSSIKAQNATGGGALLAVVLLVICTSTVYWLTI